MEKEFYYLCISEWSCELLCGILLHTMSQFVTAFEQKIGEIFLTVKLIGFFVCCNFNSNTSTNNNPRLFSVIISHEIHLKWNWWTKNIVSFIQKLLMISDSILSSIISFKWKDAYQTSILSLIWTVSYFLKLFKCFFKIGFRF